MTGCIRLMSKESRHMQERNTKRHTGTLAKTKDKNTKLS